MPCQAVVIIVIMGPYCSGFLSVPCSFLESIVEGIRTLVGWGWGLGKNELLLDPGSWICSLHPHSSFLTEAVLLSSILNIVVLPLRHHWEEKGR